MKTSLSHLPQNKQDELKEITQIIIEKVPAEMIILFGSYARGDWVEDYQEKYEYVSDFDILIVTKDKNSAKQVKKSRELDEELMADDEITRTSIIYHSIGFVNDKIERNYYFFVDILKEGIMLFDSGKFSLSEPKNLNPEQRVEKATEQFEHWFESANHFFEAFEFFFQKGENKITYYNNAAFELHQATERFYAAILLVFTDYKPRIHDIEILGQHVIKQHAEFATVFPMSTEEEKRLFVLLKKAYIDARYNRNYKIEKAELEYLGSRVALLRDLTERICRERIGLFVDRN
ncbi:HEPN domain-containing protein [Dyadobacter chenwenxiniae]|uniref:HEPN domain-containing protein n=1 Tax=Dyadobacter chenwenxiniae TaxID=2906456 RepID=A0A9X1TGN7_9BACT|nr:HEPN domain-containing protein [Dyadobacter chenwenxiniae]MCF0065756.1 HEPN domain-containing protein [Dyadobacter chenwenxiniae]UON84128.1 HEPN domain-containing protein [Dyadobacter chenwenxiniae]